ncbi:hypothetical protein N7491_006397 [Penicillium cf. griseofulvum]|uniref:Uncharacterized protein n=1 Tax=Penicillium cf. griseofulvum TaxID=2972120 RepID=A0A9W9IVW2_9EURO|nr:hypothetical protein N7472_010575 [Penicillium cf. griseofulvum]KAJ5429381.1 hypothetical protein N7491_006397 [Penicillium cf. griseofulvum]KAJ5436839.1 hypothetical protein N7445_007724 [Penicillium cf. griseofulvum]
MSIDANQSLGTLVGLDSKLILLDFDTQDRVLLIISGEVACKRSGHHVKVETEWRSKSKVYAYSIEDKLGRLVYHGSLESLLLLSYLHALTSLYLPDPLTRRTGTEQALSILRSVSVRSFNKIYQEYTEIIANIAALTPKRCYYPEYIQVMQKVYWNEDLASLIQYSDFYKEVKEIFDQDRRMALFNPDTVTIYLPLPLVDPILW